ncbi:hypothetical protein CN927_24365 [Bacillus cereus]|nr:hypothetical protein CN927_24365 [Bacillus cereus]
MIRVLFLYQKSTNKKDKIDEHDLIFNIREKQKVNTILIFIILYFLLILNIKTIINKYIYIEKFITNLVVNVSNIECKLLAISFHSNPHKH